MWRARLRPYPRWRPANAGPTRLARSHALGRKTNRGPTQSKATLRRSQPARFATSTSRAIASLGCRDEALLRADPAVFLGLAGGDEGVALAFVDVLIVEHEVDDERPVHV